MTIEIRPVRSGDVDALAAWFDLGVVTGAFDVPDFPAQSRAMHMSRLDSPWPGRDSENVLLWDGDQVIGWAVVTLPMVESVRNAFVEVAVHPDHRRQGHGTRLWQEALAIARRRDRTTIEFITPVAVEGGGHVESAGAAFAAKLADKPALLNVRRRWTAGVDVDYPAMAADAWTHAEGYVLRQWIDAAPDDMIEGLAALESRFLLDVPTGDLVVEQEVYDVERMRATENARIQRGVRLYTTVAIHVASGEIAATTLMTMEPDIADHAWQQITIGDPAHRGHRLGLLVKLANHAYVLENEPSVINIDTFNADSNRFMISVNDQMGFRATEAWQWFQIPLPS